MKPRRNFFEICYVKGLFSFDVTRAPDRRPKVAYLEQLREYHFGGTGLHVSADMKKTDFGFRVW